MNFKVLKVARGKSTAAHLTILTLLCLDDSSLQTLFMSNRMRKNLESDLDNMSLNVLRGQDINLNVEQHYKGDSYPDADGVEQQYKQNGIHFTDFPSVEWTPSAQVIAAMINSTAPAVTAPAVVTASPVEDPIGAAMGKM